MNASSKFSHLRKSIRKMDMVSSAKEEQERRGTVRLFGAFLVIITSAIIAYTAIQAIGQAQDDTLKSLRSRANILLQSRTELMDVWLESVVTSADHVTKADLFRLFADEVKSSGGIVKLRNSPYENKKDSSGYSGHTDPLILQIPYLNRVLADFVTSTSFKYAALFDENGNLIVSSKGEKVLSDVQKKMIGAALKETRFIFSPAYIDKDSENLVIDALIPITGAQSRTVEKADIIGTFLLTFPVKDKLASHLTIDGTASLPGKLRLFQRDEKFGGYEEISINTHRTIERSTLKNKLSSINFFEFSETKSLDGTDQVFTLAKQLNHHDWLLLWEVPVETAMAPVYLKEKNILLVSMLAILFIATAFTAFWWYGRNLYNQRIAKIYRKLADKIETQKWLLDSINNAVSEAIGLKDGEGRYLYANPAFARMVGRDSEEVVGHLDTTLFGEVNANKLKKWDQIVLRSGEPVTINEEAFLGKRKHYLEISKAPLNNADLSENAIVTIIRDNTELVEAEIARRHAHERTIMALAKAVETRDPHLSGHSRRVSGVAAMIAQEMALEPQDVTTVEMAGHLSQIGKIAIPKAILTKESRLNDDEIKIMQKHIEHARDILLQVDFELPIHETIYQMYERMDGGGYPRGLKGDQISIGARILGIADYFCARIEPRSYRSAISPIETVRILDSMPDRYDQDVVAALRNALDNPDVERILSRENKRK